jgi:hypothetical protein
MRVDLKMVVITNMVKCNGQMGIHTKAYGKRVKCKEEEYLNIMKVQY